jgi:transposase
MRFCKHYYVNISNCRCDGTVLANQARGRVWTVSLFCRVCTPLIALPGCGALTAAEILGETAGITPFHPAAAYARHNGTAALPVWSSNRARHRLSRTGNRQLNAALHRIAMTRARCYPPAKELITRRKAGGDGGLEALRVLKRRLSDAVYQALHADYAFTD